MTSDLRVFCIETMRNYKEMLAPVDRKWNVLEVGIAGDERPGGNYKLFGIGNNYKTLDIVSTYEPDIVADICDTKLPAQEWDLIILSNTLEHIYTYEKAIKECFRLLKPNGVLIVDIPFMYPYHPEEPDFGDFWRMSPTAITKVLSSAGFNVEVCGLMGGIFTTALARRPLYE